MISTNVFAWNILGPSNYDECILENMKGIDSEAGANFVNKSCRNKFKTKVIDNSPQRNWILYITDNDANVYYDKFSIMKKGKVVTVDWVIDLNKVQLQENNVQFYSILSKSEFDCANLTSRNLKSEGKSGHMGTGYTTSYSSLAKEESMKKDGITYRRYCMN